MSAREVSNATDEVVVGYPLPAEGRLNNVHLSMRLIGPEGNTFQSMFMYGVSGFVLPVMDPDGGDTYQAIWDAQVPKDNPLSAGNLDLDTDAADTVPEWEIGTPDLSAVLDLAPLEPIEIFRRRKYLTAADKPVLYEIVDAGNDRLIPTDSFDTKIGRRVKVQSPSVVLFGVSSPDTLNTTATEPTIPSDSEWVLLQYLEVALEQAFMSLSGLTELGAETPYEESLAFIGELVEDAVFEETAGSFVPVVWRVFTWATFDISVPGQIKVGPLTSE